MTKAGLLVEEDVPTGYVRLRLQCFSKGGKGEKKSFCRGNAMFVAKQASRFEIDKIVLRYPCEPTCTPVAVPCP